ncbi:MAG: pirin family protein [Rhodospirillales bacterium]|jgi:redox-sensitive bicupin YhaK (pirin superfamily)|nr:pirin family protein [Rhodospirillales bacterium]
MSNEQTTVAKAGEAGAALRPNGPAAGSAGLIISGRAHELAGVEIRRILPSSRRRMVGPFIFLDHIGPVALPPRRGLDVAPHPHIGLSTVTYLFEGELIHRDSLGCVQSIRPGAVNWMTAGRGIVHSERSSVEDRRIGPRLHGVQAWVALPASDAEAEPSFHHHPGDDLPLIDRNGSAIARLIAGEAFGEASPVATASPLFYLDAIVAPGGQVPVPDGYSERAIYLVAGSLSVAGNALEEGDLLILGEGEEADIRARSHSRVMVLGGEPFEEPRHIWWNFVATTRERIEQAKDDWRSGRFPQVPGEFGALPLPGE